MKTTVIFVFSIVVLIVLIFFIVNKVSNDSTNEVIHIDEIAELETFNYEQYISTDIMKSDFNYLVEKILEVHPNPKRNLDGDWNQLRQEMEKDFNKPMPIGEYAMRLMSFTSKINDAHTEVYPFNIENKQLPVGFEWVKEGLVISKSYEDLLEIGDLVTKVGNRSTEEIFNIIGKYISSENEYWVKQKGKNFLRLGMFLEHLSVINDDAVTITVERDKKTLEIDVALVTQKDIQLFKANEQRPSWYSWDIKQDYNIGYFVIGESNISEEFEEEVSLFFEKVNKASIDTVIIDLRSNSGGNSGVMDPFLKHLPTESIFPFTGVIKYSEEARLQRGYSQTTGQGTFAAHTGRFEKDFIYKGDMYILTSPSTYSSGSMFAVLFHDSNLATIVGEPTGNSPSSFGDTINLTLPYTKFALFISHKEFRRPDLSVYEKKILYPQILVEKTQADIISRKDQQLERILKMIGETKGE